MVSRGPSSLVVGYVLHALLEWDLSLDMISHHKV
jgi:hypothetical protein